MPVIGKIDGIVLRMFFGDHPPPHFHATINEYSGLFSISSGKVITGNMKIKDQKLVESWMNNREKLLMKMWNSQKIVNIQNQSDDSISKS
jgi:hypothetical protein